MTAAQLGWIFADVSHWNATVDLAAYAAAGHRLVAIKATDGDAGVDPRFGPRWALARRAGLRRIAYHYLRNTDPGEDQADHYLDVIAAVGGLAAGDLLCVDVEDEHAPEMAKPCLRRFCRQATARGHPAGWIYSRAGYLTPARITPAGLPPGWCRLWLANYRAAEPDGAIALPAGWTPREVAARQYTDAATLPGITGRVDASRLLHDPEQQPMDLTDPHAQAILRSLIDERLRGWLTALATGELNGTTGTEPTAVTELRAALDQITTGGQPAIDVDALAAALAGPLAAHLVDHLRLTAT